MKNSLPHLTTEWHAITTFSTTSTTVSVCDASIIHYGVIRWYEPVPGRWLSNDPIGISGGLNQYVFCQNNPVNFRDPSGLWNYWNPATWGVENGVGYNWWDSFNPFHESAGWSGAFWGASEAAVAFWDVALPFMDFEYIY